MKKLLILAGIVAMVGCEKTTVTPAAEPGKDTTIVVPGAEKKTETNTTIVAPAASKTETSETKTETKTP